LNSGERSFLDMHQPETERGSGLTKAPDTHMLENSQTTTQATKAVEPSAGQARFQSCRWRLMPDGGGPAHCTHRDVLPMAGTTGFNPDAWCPDCSFYKLRRTPRR
jgi:hypothetical protein